MAISDISPDRASKLYTPEILGLAVTLAEYPLNASAQYQGYAVSRSCGSSVGISVSLDNAGAISDIGMNSVACAIGQAASAVFAQDAKGKNMQDVTAARRSIADWLTGAGDMPTWRSIDALSRARDFPGRHDAIVLPWTAAIVALSKTAGDR